MMPFTFDTPLAKIVVGEGGQVEFRWYGRALYRDMSVVLACVLTKFFTAERNETSDELEDGLQEIQEFFVDVMNYEKAMVARDARNIIQRLVRQNEDYRCQIQRMTAPHRPTKEVED